MKQNLLIYTLFILLFGSCKKFIQLDESPSSISVDKVFQQDATAVAAMSAVYKELSNALQGQQGLAYVNGLSADEITYFGTWDIRMQIYQNRLSSANSEVAQFWQRAYSCLYLANGVLEGVEHSTGLSVNVARQLRGEALFSRAFIYFQLVNWYGDVPLITSTRFSQNEKASRTPSAMVYQQILADLEEAVPLLTPHYISGAGTPTNRRIRPNRSAVQSLLAKVHLYNRNWDDVASYATQVIDNSAEYEMTPISDVFISSSREAIWQLDGGGFPTQEEGIFPVTFSAAMHPNLFSAFQADDTRKSNWIGTDGVHNFAYKYKETADDYFTVFRLAEIYLIRAEARIHTGQLTGAESAISDVNIIRERANLLASTAITKMEVMAEIEQQRRLELFSEMGNRWFDLKRWPALNNPQLSRADEVIPALAKGGTWLATAKLYPVPQTERRANSNLSQNLGYEQ